MTTTRDDWMCPYCGEPYAVGRDGRPVRTCDCRVERKRKGEK